jgi:hypothetical protein
MDIITEERAAAIYAAHRADKAEGPNAPGYVRDYVLPNATAADIWRLCDAVRAASTYPEHVPTVDTTSTEDARDWLDGLLA